MDRVAAVRPAEGTGSIFPPNAPRRAPGGTAMNRDKVRDWMTPHPITIDVSATVVDAINLLKERNIRRLPVVSGGRLAGLITERMLLSYSSGRPTSGDDWELHYQLAKTPVTEAMNPKPHTVTPDTPLADAAQLVHDRKLNGITVVDEGGELVGILTNTNFLEALIWCCRSHCAVGGPPP